MQAEDRVGQNAQAVQPEEEGGVSVPLQDVPVCGERGRIDLAYGEGGCRDSVGFLREQEVGPQFDGAAFARAHGSGEQIDESAVPEMRGGGEAPDILLIRKGAEFFLMQEKSRAARAKGGKPGRSAERFQQGSSVHDFSLRFLGWRSLCNCRPPGASAEFSGRPAAGKNGASAFSQGLFCP